MVDGPVVRRRHGQPLSLHCQCRGVPTPTVDWLKNGQVITIDDHSRVFISTDEQDGVTSSHLRVEQASVHDSGMYQCQATNHVGVDLATTWVDILVTGMTVPPVNSACDLERSDL